MDQQLQAKVRISWQATTFGQALPRLAQTQRVAIVRDRRVDPNAPLELTIDGEPLGKALQRIAAARNLGYTQFGPVAYLGPTGAADRLRTLAAVRLDEARTMPEDLARKILVERNWRWEEASEPQAFLAELAAEIGLELSNPERMPFDVWAAGNLPLLNWAERMTLLLLQFDLTYQIDVQQRRLTLIGIPEEILLTREYAGGRNPRALSRRLARELPQAAVSLSEDGRIRVAASCEQHEQIERLIGGTPTRKTMITPGKEVYQLTVPDTALDKLVDQLAERLELQIDWDREATAAAGVANSQLVTVHVQDADLDALLKAVFAGTGLTARRQGNKVFIRAH